MSPKDTLPIDKAYFGAKMGLHRAGGKFDRADVIVEAASQLEAERHMHLVAALPALHAVIEQALAKPGRPVHVGGERASRVGRSR
jgi:hypothetical protein